ncbi:MAG: hypothetical protein JWQ14_1163 [Adhaeribacter sp.]|nr:hypothetical protein [Adhaeribacter sp.]
MKPPRSLSMVKSATKAITSLEDKLFSEAIFSVLREPVLEIRSNTNQKQADE